MAEQPQWDPGQEQMEAGRFVLRAKLHRARVTDADKDYEGSLTLDRHLLVAADMIPFEQVHVWNVTRGTRFQTYTMESESGSGVVCINGAAAHLAGPGDIIIVASFTHLPDAQARAHRPRIVLLDEHNRIKETDPHQSAPTTTHQEE